MLRFVASSYYAVVNSGEEDATYLLQSRILQKNAEPVAPTMSSDLSIITPGNPLWAKFEPRWPADAKWTNQNVSQIVLKNPIKEWMCPDHNGLSRGYCSDGSNPYLPQRCDDNLRAYDGNNDGAILAETNPAYGIGSPCDCHKLCEARSDCVGWTYSHGVSNNRPSSGCYLRASWGTRVDDCWGGWCVSKRKESTPAETVYPVITPKQCPSTRHGHCGRGRSLETVQASTPGECCDKCHKNPECGGYEFTHNGGNCTLKSECLNIYAKYPSGASEQMIRAVGPIWRKENFTSDVMTCPTTQFMDCPGNDLSFANPFFPSSGRNGVSQIGIAECCRACFGNPLCKAFIYKNITAIPNVQPLFRAGGRCELKSSCPKDKMVHNPQVWGGGEITRPVITTTTTTTTTTATAAACPKAKPRCHPVSCVRGKWVCGPDDDDVVHPNDPPDGTDNPDDGTDAKDDACFDGLDEWGGDFECRNMDVEAFCNSDSAEGYDVGYCCPDLCKTEAKTKNKEGKDKKEAERKSKREAARKKRKASEKERKKKRSQDEFERKRKRAESQNKNSEDERKKKRKWDEKKTKGERKWKNGLKEKRNKAGNAETSRKNRRAEKKRKNQRSGKKEKRRKKKGKRQRNKKSKKPRKRKSKRQK